MMTVQDVTTLIASLGALVVSFSTLLTLWKNMRTEHIARVKSEAMTLARAEMVSGKLEVHQKETAVKMDELKAVTGKTMELANGSHHAALEGQAIALRGEKNALLHNASSLRLIAELRNTPADRARADEAEQAARDAEMVYLEHLRQHPSAKAAEEKHDSPGERGLQ